MDKALFLPTNVVPALLLALLTLTIFFPVSGACLDVTSVSCSNTNNPSSADDECVLVRVDLADEFDDGRKEGFRDEADDTQSASSSSNSNNSSSAVEEEDDVRPTVGEDFEIAFGFKRPDTVSRFVVAVEVDVAELLADELFGRCFDIVCQPSSSLRLILGASLVVSVEEEAVILDSTVSGDCGGVNMGFLDSFSDS